MLRQFTPGLFIRDTVGPSLGSRTVTDRRPVLGIDEGLNDKLHIAPMVTRLVARGIVSSAIPLWYQFRVLADGTRMNVLGSEISVSPFMPDVGRQERGTSWPDEGVVAHLVGYFLYCDRICLLTQNTSNDADGLRRILQTEVAPVLEALVPRRLGFLALVQKPRAPLEEYSALVEQRLATTEIQAGFHWELLPE
jgi:hypothetical protein